jgi:hypothetical protein
MAGQDIIRDIFDSFVFCIPIVPIGEQVTLELK